MRQPTLHSTLYTLHLNAALIIILLTSPLVLWLLCQLLPTFDDWTYYTVPYMGKLFSSRLLPIDSWWRPFDHVFGWIVGLNYRLFPTLNHVFVYAAHLVSTLLLWRIAGQLSFSRFGQTIAVLIFYLSPAMLGTVTGIDSLNQAYSHLWGLVAMTIYLKDEGLRIKDEGLRMKDESNNPSSLISHPSSSINPSSLIPIPRCARPPVAFHLSSLFAIIIATLCKENGYMWAIIIPFVAWAFQIIDSRRLRRDWIIAIALAVVYFVVRLLLTTNQVDINQEYLHVTLSDRLRDIATFLGLTWVPIDYVALFNLISHLSPLTSHLLIGLSAVLGLPFMLYVYFGNPRNLFNRRHLVLFASIILAALPHLITLFTTMHAYAGLSMAALSMAWLSERLKRRKTVVLLFSLYLVNVIAVDLHHGVAAWQSGQIGKRMGVEAIRKTGQPVDTVSIIYINTGERRYSSFCCIPYEAFAWGHTALYETGYQWPNNFQYHEIAASPTDRQQALDLARKDIDQNKSQCAWIVRKDQIEVVR